MAWQSTLANVANDSFSHRSSHQRHGHEVAEPHVGHLVQHGLGAPLVGRAGDAAAEDVVLEEGHRAGVLHRARVELRHEQLVVLAERVPDAEVAVVEVEALLGLGEQPLGVHVLGERGAAVDAQGDGLPGTVVDVLVAPLRVRARDQRHEVGAEDLGGGETVHRGRTGLLDLGGRVRDDLPGGGCGDGEGVAGLEVRLVEAGEHPLGVRGLELRVEVDGAVDGVDEAVQALAGVHVPAGRDHDELVLGGQARQRDPVVFAVGGHVERRAVERGRGDPGTHEVDPAVRAGLTAAEVHRGGGGEGRLAGRAGAVGEVELDGVRGDVQQRGPPLGVDAGQVGRGHAVSDSSACRFRPIQPRVSRAGGGIPEHPAHPSWLKVEVLRRTSTR